MPAKSPVNTELLGDNAALIGRQFRDRRKALRVSATSASESAGMSRATWHRIERGELSVTMGAYLAAAEVLGMSLTVAHPDQTKVTVPGDIGVDWLPLRIPLSDYPQLRQLAWQVQGVEELTPREALSFYERNWRHLDVERLEPHEQKLIAALRERFAGIADV